ncbi:peptidase [Winogradskyella aurantia]|uniref:Peptidase n=2 Tax=Winogradskyella aurantia TaxID=1915063 RepID=A0A265USJ1_9FLAO|nr:peptidase [Winogradskyella aurantia]
MIKTIFTFLFSILTIGGFAQSIDDPFSQKKMKKDFKIFKEIRIQANSGLYKYRTKEQIDSTYHWADQQIEKSSTYLDFYNIICQLTDYEGSLHNNTSLPKKYAKRLREENEGYFPYPIKWIDGKWLINYENGEVPLGTEIISINGIPISEVIENLYKYYTTDGRNITGKRIGIRTHFAKYFRFHYGQQQNFNVVFKRASSNETETKSLQSVSYKAYYQHFHSRYSKPYDHDYYKDLNENQKYRYKQIDASTGVLTINTFAMGSETTQEHKNYLAFLDSTFADIKAQKLKNLVVDVRQCGGGTDPNDVVTYSYLTQRKFQESKQVWISFNKIPLLKHFDSSVPKFLRPLGVGKFNRDFQNRFPKEKDGKYYISDEENEMKIREPNENAFTGNIYLLISPAVASAGSLFAAMVAGNKNTTVIGEETMGGYYGHNGHISFGYVLPKSKIITDFSIDNIEQDVPEKDNQSYDRGIIPDLEVSQTYQDFLAHRDTQMAFTLQLIETNEK